MKPRRPPVTRAAFRRGVPADCPLAATELRVLTLLADGKTRKQVAAETRRTVSSVWNLTNRACDRLGARHVGEAILACHEARWLEIRVRPHHHNAPLTQVQQDYVRAFTALIKHSPAARDRLLEGLMAK